MSLPWFPFHIKDFLANTLRLNTEATGAYLRLMLDYYQGEEALPDDDDVLAAIAGLSIESWNRHRKVLAPLFDIRDGYWYHDRIAEEIEVGKRKLASSKARAEAGAAAMHEKYGHKPAPSRHKAGHKPINNSKSASSQPKALLEIGSSSAPLTLTSTLSNERVVAAAPNDDARQAANGLGEGKDTQFPPQAPNPLGTTLPETWVPGEIEIACAHEYGMNDDDLKAEVFKFHALNAQNGTFSKNWSATWQLFCARFKERQASLPKPRVDVNASASEGPYVPKPAEWERALMRWQRGDQSGWPRNLLGPEPGQARCRVPKDLLEQYNIDPRTGLMVAVRAKEAS